MVANNAESQILKKKSIQNIFKLDVYCDRNTKRFSLEIYCKDF